MWQILSFVHFLSVVCVCVCVCVGEKKLGRVICPDPWKSGARNTVGEETTLH